MSTRLLATLEQAIQKWADQQCEQDDWPEGYWYDDQVEDMALSAYTVLMASVKGQKFSANES